MVFIDPEQIKREKKDLRPAAYLRKEFDVKENLVSATLHVTALGVYYAFVNGKPVDDQLLMPGFTNYSARLQVQEYDVLSCLLAGRNALAAILGEGWYRGVNGAMNKSFQYGNNIALAARLTLKYSDGTEDVISTDSSWKASQDGPILDNSLKTYEKYDAQKEMPGWNTPGFNDSGWHFCKISSYSGTLVPHEGERLKEHEHFTGNILTTPAGETVVDFGQNLSGRVEFTVTGHAGHTVKLEMGETLDENGNFTVKNLEGDESVPLKMHLGQTVIYTLKEGRQTFKPHFLISGYRYVKLSDWPEEAKSENFTSIAVYSDLRNTGSFRCSNPKINRFLENTRWSWKSNSVDVPTDCPTRERAGWTGDINVFSEAANYLSDTRKFMWKYMEDFKSHQQRNGSLPYIVPVMGLFPSKLNNFANSSAGWADAMLNVPMILYMFYGDPSVLAQIYDSAKMFVDYNIKRSLKGRKKYILSKGFHWGEWLEPGANPGKDMAVAFFHPDSEVATAWLYQSTRQLSEMAGILGNKSDELKYSELANSVRRSYRNEFLKDGKVVSKRQCRFVRPVAMGLAEPSECVNIIGELNELIKQNDYRIGTGFLTTYKILQVLADNGYADTAYKMLENEQCPGWMYEVNKGATTIWETWNGIDDKGVPHDSLNHYSPGAVSAFLFSHIGGIRPAAPGFRKVTIRPLPGGSLTEAETSYDSVQGQIATFWKIEGQTFALHVEIPKDIEAEVILPDGQSFVQTVPAADYNCLIDRQGALE